MTLDEAAVASTPNSELPAVLKCFPSLAELTTSSLQAGYGWVKSAGLSQLQLHHLLLVGANRTSQTIKFLLPKREMLLSQDLVGVNFVWSMYGPGQTDRRHPHHSIRLAQKRACQEKVRKIFSLCVWFGCQWQSWFQGLCLNSSAEVISRILHNSLISPQCDKVNHTNASNSSQLFSHETDCWASVWLLRCSRASHWATGWQITSLPIWELGQFSPQPPPDGPN